MTVLERGTGAITDPDFLDFGAKQYIQAAELDEMQAVAAGRIKRVGNVILRDGDPQSGCDIRLDGSSVVLDSGTMWIDGDVREIAARTIADVSLTGTVRLGAKLAQVVTTAEQNPALKGQTPDTAAFGEDGADRRKGVLSWVMESEPLAEGEFFFPVYVIKEGQIQSRLAPPELTGVAAVVGKYDYDVNGNYAVAEGLRVTALGKIAAAQHFALSEGTANVNGVKRIIPAGRRHIEPESFDTASIAGETKAFANGGSGPAAIAVNQTPIAGVSQVLAIVERTATVTRGSGSGTSDALPDANVLALVSVTQGGTTFAPVTSYLLSADRVDWSPAGPEPATSSTYQVVYRCRVEVPANQIEFNDTTVTVTQAGAVTGSEVLLNYTYKLPRRDLLCLDSTGGTVYVKGISARQNPQAPLAPSNLLPLAQVFNEWRGASVVTELNFRAKTQQQRNRVEGRLEDLLVSVMDGLRTMEAVARDPASKRGLFIDNFIDDSKRDAGAGQTATVADGLLRLTIDKVFHQPVIDAALTLPWVHERIIDQDLQSDCQLINQFANFAPLPGAMKLTPAVDRWVEDATQWLSARTRNFGVGNVVRSTTRSLLVGTAQAQAQFLRQISVDYVISGFAPNEPLASLTFDGISVLSGTPAANAQGVINGTLAIPAGVTAGTKTVRAVGAGGTEAQASFTGQGIINVTTMRRVTTITRVPQQERGGGGGGDRGDPVAMTFTPLVPRQLTGIGFKFCNIGNRDNAVVVDLREVDDGIITTQTVAQSVIPMASAVANAETLAAFDVPVFTDRERAFVIKTDDNVHAVAVARLGGYDAVKAKRITAQPYGVGVLAIGSNDRSWTYVQDSDMTFFVNAAKYTATSRTVNLGTFPLANVSDLLVRATIDLPTEDCAAWFEIVRQNGQVISLQANDPVELNEFLNESVVLRLQMRGSETASPVVWPDVLLVAGTLRETGTYITRRVDMGTGVDAKLYLDTVRPSGSTIEVAIEDGAGVWQPMGEASQLVLDDGWMERFYRRNPHTAADGSRFRITLSGTPGARPYGAALKAYSI